MTSREYQEGWVRSGGGLSFFPECNKPEYFADPVYRKIIAMGTSVRVTSMLIHQPFSNKLRPFLTGDPGTRRQINPLAEAHNIMQGMWTGELGWDAWDDLERRANASFDKALADAQKDGIKVKREDFIFPDWDPAENYPPPKEKK